MVKRFLEFIEQNVLCNTGDEILVTVSGGVDSMVLASLFKACGFSFSVAHCNFNLRGDESDGDEKFVKQWAESIGHKCYVKSFDTKNYADQHGVSIEMAARTLRYAWFYELAETHDYTCIATAHHLNDSLETSIYNLVRGTGISGVRGISVKNKRVIRPMLCFTKTEVKAYAENEGIRWREDSTNVSVDYMRNRIRNNVVPELKQINYGLENTFKHTQQRLREAESILRREVEKYKAKLKQDGDDVYLEKKWFAKIEESIIIEELLKPFGFNYTQVLDIQQALKGTEVGKVFYSKSYCLNIDREVVIISAVSEQANEEILIEIDDVNATYAGGKLKLYTSLPHQGILKEKTAVSIDFDKLKFPLKIRKWQQGDSFIPLGMKGKKKLSDFMIDEKIPLNLKERVYLLMSENDVVWVIGHRVDNRFKVTAHTKEIYNLVIASHG